MAYAPILAEAARHWWTFLLRGILAVLFAVTAFMWPGLTLAVLVIFWGAFAIVDGVFAIVAGARSRWWSVLVFGLLGVAAGLIAFFMPGLTALVLVMVVAAWAVVRGALEIAAAIRLRKELTGEWLLVVAGALSIGFGLLMFAYPAAGALALVWLIALQAFVAGVILMAVAFRLRRLKKHSQPMRVDLGTPSHPGVKA